MEIKHVTITLTNNGYLVIPNLETSFINNRNNTVTGPEYYVFETRKSLVRWLSKNLALPDGFVGVMKESIKK